MQFKQAVHVTTQYAPTSLLPHRRPSASCCRADAT